MKKLNIFLSIFALLFIIILITFLIIYIINNKSNSKDKKEKVFYELKSFENEISNIDEHLENYSQEELENRLKSIYNSWSYIILDLSNIEKINKDDLSSFGKEIDNLIISIKSKDRYKINNNIITIYSKLINYFNTLDYDIDYINILKAKYNLLIANNSVTNSNWQLTKDAIEKAINYIYEVIKNDKNSNKYVIEQAYIMLNESKNIIQNKDSEVFNIKYKLIMEKLNDSL